MTSKQLSGWLLVLGPLTVFILAGFLKTVLVGPAETTLSAVTEIDANQSVTVILTILGAIGFVAALIGAIMLTDEMRVGDKLSNGLARIGGVILVGITALAMVAAMVDAATVGALQSTAGDAAQRFQSAVQIQIIGQTLWAGMFFFWGIAFLLLGMALVMQKKLHIVVDWLFVIFGALFVILSIVPLDLAASVGLIIFGLMSLNTVAAGIIQLRSKDS
mgnify:CR=1 FL=1